MLKISSRQLAALNEEMRQRTVERAIGFLFREHPEWCTQWSSKEIRDFCTNTLAIAHDHRLNSWISVQHLLEWHVSGLLPSSFSEWQNHLLTRLGVDEKTRLAEFKETLTGNDQRMLISLNTDLAEIR